jgi:uncharacterized protein involved in tolerance to divalent cations
MIKSKRMTWAGHVALIEEKRKACMILVESSKKRYQWEGLT